MTLFSSSRSTGASQHKRALEAMGHSVNPISAVLAAALLATGAAAWAAPVQFDGTAYTQDFNSLTSVVGGTDVAWRNDSTLPSWHLFNSSSAAIENYRGSDGTSNTGRFYSFGANGAADRALGGVASANLNGWMALAVANKTGGTLDAVKLAFQGEQWRNGGNASTQAMTLEYGSGATFAEVDTWQEASHLSWSSPVATETAAAVNGNAEGGVPVEGVISGLAWAPEAVLWLRWAEKNDLGNDHGLAIDDFSLSLAAAPHQLFTPEAGATAGSSDASTAIALDADWMVVGDDEASVLRVYPRAGGQAVKAWDFNAVLGLAGEELDVEASAKVGNTMYFIGSHSNKKGGNEADSREHLFAVTLTGTGAQTSFSPVGSAYQGLETVLANWDLNNVHGKGVSFFGLSASAAGGVVPEASNGFSIEGMAATPSGALLLGFRAPQASASVRTKALLVPLMNPSEVLSGSAPVLGTPMELDLGGRGIRSIELAGDGKYLIVAGPAVGATATASSRHFALYVWDGSSSTATRLDNDLDALLLSTGGSFETLVSPSSTAPGTEVQLLQDNGDTVWTGQTAISKDLPAAEQRFAGNWLTLGSPVAQDNTAPALSGSSPANNATGVSIGVQPVLTFDEPVRLGAGSFVISAGGAVVATLPASDSSQVKFSGNTVTLAPSALLSASASHQVTVQGTPVLDEAGNAWAGPMSLSFTTGAAPEIASYKVLISEVNSNAEGGDFFEVHNHGSTAIDLSAWRWTDSGEAFVQGKVFPNGIVLQPGKSLVVVAEGAPAAFCAAWGMNDCSHVIEVVGKGLGKGDAVFLYDAYGQIVSSVVYGLNTVQGKPPVLNTAGAAPQVSAHAGPAVAAAGIAVDDGVSAVWDGVSTTDPRYTTASVGVLGAFAQPQTATSVGSPGAAAALAAAANVTLISAIQGSGDASPLAGQTVTISGVITSFAPNLKGFFVQEEAADSDNNPATSEGVFVYYNTTNPGVSDASVGQQVQLTATVGNYSGNTQLIAPKDVTVLGPASLPAPVQLTLPVSDMAVWEGHEGMLVEVKAASGEPLVVSDSYELGRYGSVALSPGKPLVQFTETNEPSAAGFAAYAAQTRRMQIILDDNNSAQNPETVWGRNGQPLSASNTLRAGDGTSSVVGVLDQFQGSSDPAYATSYRVQPTLAPVFTGPERPTAEDLHEAVGQATVKVAAINVLNYFNQTSGNFTTPLGNSMAVRGAENEAEHQRQLDKLVAQIIGMGSDVYGLMEIQNNGFGPDSALQSLTNALNASAHKPAGAVFDFVKGPFTDGSNTAVSGAGSDAITVAILYRSDRVKPEGQAAVANPATYSSFDGATGGSRVPVLQTFSVPLGDRSESFSVAVNHFKSKGSVLPGAGNADQGDGEGNNGAARVLASNHLKAWLDTKPTGVETPRLVLMGDFNGYARERVITTLEGNGFTKVNTGHSYSFDGLWGSLDHILVSQDLLGHVGKVVDWAVNAEEPTALDYNTNFKTAAAQANFYDKTLYRASDHNPIVMGLNFNNLPPVIAGVPQSAQAVKVGVAADLEDITVADVDSSALLVTLQAVNGELLGVTDIDPATEGVQLQGTPQALNTALAALQFKALAAGAASVQMAVADGVNAAVTASYPLHASVDASDPNQPDPQDPLRNFTFTPAGQAAVSGSIRGGGEQCQISGQPEAVTPERLGAMGLPVADATMPYGVLKLSTTECAVRGEVNVTLTYPQALPAGTEYWKWGRTADNTTPHWYRLPATVSGNTIAFTLIDGGLGDDDLQADGKITDPGGPVVPAAPLAPAAIQPVPATSTWGMALLSLLMGVGMAWRGRKTNAQR